jgi:tetratricopeptide (TPR) repeat protein
MAPLLLLALFLPTGDSQPPARRSSSPGSSAFARLAQQADQARQANQAESAIVLYQRALRLKPDWKEGWWYLGTLDYQTDRYTECRDALRRLTAIEQNGGPAWSMLGLCEFQTKEYDLALAHLRHGQELGVAGVPQIDEVAKYHLALLLTRNENYEKSLDLFFDLARHGKDDADMIVAAGIAAMRRPLLPEGLPVEEREITYLAGRAVWDAGARRAAQAQRNFDALLARFPTSPGVHFLYGSFLLQEEPDKGIAELQKEIAISPGHVPARVQIAFEYLRRGEPAKGLPYASEAVRLAPDSVVAHTVLGRSLAETGELEPGVKELELAEKLAPDSPQPRIALASVYAKLGRNEDAARERREFLRLKEISKSPGEP